MESNKINISKNERRSSKSNQQILLSQLSNSQHFSIQALKIFGYSFHFIRKINNKNIPILSFNNSFATINIDGEININADIKVRS